MRIIFTLVVAALLFAWLDIYQASIIQQQQDLIRNMVKNPNCLTEEGAAHGAYSKAI